METIYFFIILDSWPTTTTCCFSPGLKLIVAHICLLSANHLLLTAIICQYLVALQMSHNDPSPPPNTHPTSLACLHDLHCSMEVRLTQFTLDNELPLCGHGPHFTPVSWPQLNCAATAFNLFSPETKPILYVTFHRCQWTAICFETTVSLTFDLQSQMRFLLFMLYQIHITTKKNKSPLCIYEGLIYFLQEQRVQR